MYDKLHIELRHESIYDIEKIAQRLENPKIFYNYDFGFKGSLRNFDVTLTKGRIRLVGSLCKFFWGDNVRNIHRLETMMAIMELSEILNLPMDKAKITYLEFGRNFEMEYLPKAYFWHLGNHKSLNRFIQPISLYYKTKCENRQYIFYDKMEESKGVTIPNKMADKNWLRFEIRLKRLTELFGKSEITCEDLYDKVFYQKLLDYYIGAYMEINKNPIVSLDYSLLESPTDCKEYLVMCFIEIFGQNEAIALIEDMRVRKTLKRNEYYSKMINYINDLCDRYKDINRTPIIDELTTKVLALNDSVYSY